MERALETILFSFVIGVVWWGVSLLPIDQAFDKFATPTKVPPESMQISWDELRELAVSHPYQGGR